MIVFLDMKAQSVKIYTNSGLKEFSFGDTQAIRQIIGSKQVFYVTGALRATGDEVAEVVKGIADSMGIKPEDATGAFLHSTVKGQLQIPNMELTFLGPHQCFPLKRLYAQYGSDMFQKYKILGQLIKMGKLEILSKKEAIAAAKKYNIEMDIRNAKYDKALDNILVDSSQGVESYMDTYDEDSIPGDHSDMIEIDIKSGGGGGGSGNEGTILPEGFVG